MVNPEHQRPRLGALVMVEVVGVEPTSKKCRLAVLPQAWSVLETSRRGTDEPLGTLASRISAAVRGRRGSLSGASVRQAEATLSEV